MKDLLEAWERLQREDPAPYHLAMPCTPGLAESPGDRWQGYSSIESDKTGCTIVDGVQDDTAPALRDLLNTIPGLLERVTWIRCEDRMPEAGVYVMVWVPDLGHHEIGRFMGLLGGRTSWWKAANQAWETYEVTHWMSLPEPPEES